MKDRENIRKKAFSCSHLKRIGELEAEMIDNKLGATVRGGGYNHLMMVMMHETKKFNKITIPKNNRTKK